MPVSKRLKTPKRHTVRLPDPMLSEIDRIVREYPMMNYTRQQFIESAIREKIEALWSIRPKGSRKGIKCTYCGEVVVAGKLDTLQEITSAAATFAAHMRNRHPTTIAKDGTT